MIRIKLSPVVIKKTLSLHEFTIPQHIAVTRVLAVWRDRIAGSTRDWVLSPMRDDLAVVQPHECLKAPEYFYGGNYDVIETDRGLRFSFPDAETWDETIREDLVAGERRLLFPVEQRGHNGHPHVLWADVE